MPDGDVETFHEGGAWHNRIEGQGGLLNTHTDKTTAVEAGRAEARRRQVEHIIKNIDGTTGERTATATTRVMYPARAVSGSELPRGSPE